MRPLDTPEIDLDATASGVARERAAAGARASIYQLFSPLGRSTRAFFAFFGVDQAVAYVIFGRMLSVITAPVTLYLIVRRLSPNEQGYYYTFNNLLGLTVFFELGLNYVIMQFASHEMASLQWSSRGTLEGNDMAKARLASLLRKALAWYAVAATLIVLVVLPVGLRFFSQHGVAGVNWRAAWIWMVIASAAWCAVSPSFSVLMGCGLVTEMYRNGLIQQAGSALLLWLVLSLNGGLFAAPVAASFGSLFAVWWFWQYKREFVRNLWRERRAEPGLSWRREIWPMQWKIAMSWASGYLITQLFNPILFRYWGPAVAGQMGMTLTITSALAATSAGWLNSKAPEMGTLVAKRQFRDLDRLALRATWQSLLVLSLGAATVGLAIVWLQRSGYSFGHRVLPARIAALLLLNAIAAHVLTAMTLYLRAFRAEPFAPVYVVYGLCVAASCYFLGRHYGAAGMGAGYLASTVIVGLGGGLFVFVRKRREWQTRVTEESPPEFASTAAVTVY